jgi:hypothetical protein
VRGRQRELAQLLQSPPVRDESLGHELVERIVAASSPDLSTALQWIKACEALMVPSGAVFSHLSRQDGERPADVVSSLDKHFGSVPSLLPQPELQLLEESYRSEPQLQGAPLGPDGSGADRWLQIARTLRAKDFGELIPLLLTQNELVSQSRGGARGWVVLGDRGRLQVSQADLSWEALPEGPDLLQRWVNPYFLPNLRTMAVATAAA